MNSAIIRGITRTDDEEVQIRKFVSASFSVSFAADEEMAEVMYEEEE